jgi:hypothetical protein
MTVALSLTFSSFSLHTNAPMFMNDGGPERRSIVMSLQRVLDMTIGNLEKQAVTGGRAGANAEVAHHTHGPYWNREAWNLAVERSKSALDQYAAFLSEEDKKQLEIMKPGIVAQIDELTQQKEQRGELLDISSADSPTLPTTE